MDNGASPVLIASENNNAEFLRLLLQHGGDHTLANDGMSPLFQAAQNNNMECLRLANKGTVTSPWTTGQVQCSFHRRITVRSASVSSYSMVVTTTSRGIV
eukprot:5694524-Prorocentrum_lima.AAC.1